VSEIKIGTLLIFRFRVYWTEKIHYGVVLDMGSDPFITENREVYYVYTIQGDHVFVTEDEIEIMEII
tara:strand:- start:5495 stop:5695 length:201 start_codon:yes stop_codon:yes gene_type:complete